MKNYENKNSYQKSKLINKNFISSGNLFLDKILGGFSLGAIVLLVEDNPTYIYENFLRYFIAEGVVNYQKTFFYYNNENNLTNVYKNLPYKSSQVESILNAKRVNHSKSSEMQIAWRYENIKYSNILDDIIKSSDYIFDLSRQLQETFLIDKNKNVLNNRLIEIEINDHGPIEYINSLTQKIIQDYQYCTINLQEDEIRIMRFVASNLFYDDITAGKKGKLQENFLSHFKIQLAALKNTIRSINGVLFITINKEFVNDEIYKLLFYFSDYVFALKSFMMDPQRLEDYDGLFYIKKLPKICTMKSCELETDTYGIIMEKRKVIIEKIDIGVEIDRNTKVKEKDLPASQAMCGQEKYSKDYEF